MHQPQATKAMHQLKTMVHQADGANKATLHLIATHQLQAIAMEVAHMVAHTVVPNRLQSTKLSPWVAVQADVSILIQLKEFQEDSFI